VQVAGGADLFSTGTMRDPQMYMVALCLALGLLAPGAGSRRSRRGWAAAAVLLVVGMILHFKRGVWAAATGAVAIMALAGRRRRLLAGIVLCVAVAAALPPVRARWQAVGDEYSYRMGGRYLLWSRVAPELLREHPAGIGWCAVRHEDLLEISRYVQPKLNHLHNNILQVALELGWAGLAAWFALVIRAGCVMARNYRHGLASGCPAAAWPAWGVLGAFSGLMLNGLVEYNFGDGEILMVLALLMGLSALPSAEVPARGGAEAAT
jgi:O-antigen ligase